MSFPQKHHIPFPDICQPYEDQVFQEKVHLHKQMPSKLLMILIILFI